MKTSIRQVLLETVNEYATKGSQFQAGTVLKEAARKLGTGGDDTKQQALLTAFHDLYRSGQLTWGFNISNDQYPFCHLTDRGRDTLRHLTRDPSNPDGYLGHLADLVTLQPVPQSYIEEALQTYNAGCYKASAVMVGCAAESLVMLLRDALVHRMSDLSETVPKKLNDWKARTVATAIQSVLDGRAKSMGRSLRESYEAYWPAFTQQIRAARNEAGHPSSIDPITFDTVHAALLVFPELAVMCSNLNQWIEAAFV